MNALLFNLMGMINFPHLVGDVGPGTSCESAGVLKSAVYPMLAQLKGAAYVFIVIAIVLAVIVAPVLAFTKHRGVLLNVVGISILAILALAIGLQFLDSVSPLKCA